MKLKVAINGEIDVSPEVAAQLRSGIVEDEEMVTA